MFEFLLNVIFLLCSCVMVWIGELGSMMIVLFCGVGGLLLM